MPIIFFLGILGIAFEDKIKVNKSATALAMCVILWSLLIITFVGEYDNIGFFNFLKEHPELAEVSKLEQSQQYISTSLITHLGDVSTTLFFVLCSMLIVNTVDRYGGFKELTNHIATTDKRRLLWTVSIIAFLFSALFDNLAAAIVIIAILRKLVPDHTDRLKYACISIIACNAGGSWSPIGDVTTLLLWNNGYITAKHQILHLFIPALTSLLVPVTICHFWLFKKKAKLRQDPENMRPNKLKVELPSYIRKTILWIGILSLAMVPVYQIFFQIPAFLGAIIGLTILWIYTDLMLARHQKKIAEANNLQLIHLLKDADLGSIFFFLGILMSVAALTTGGQLGMASTHLECLTSLTDSVTANSAILASLIGVCSSLLDNVALVAATMGIFPIGHNAAMVLDGTFWTFLAYTAVTGGSLLIIGSATGVAVMGMEKISFGYYFKRFSGLALAGFISGAAVYLLFCQ